MVAVDFRPRTTVDVSSNGRTIFRAGSALDLPASARLGGDKGPLALVRQRAVAGRHVLPQMVRLRGRRDRAGDGRVRDHPLQQQLTPGLAAEVGGPGRYRPALQPTE